MLENVTKAELTTRFLAFIIDIIIYVAIFYGLGGLGHFIAMLYILFRDGFFGGQSIGKKILGLRVAHLDGRKIGFVDSSFRNITFMFYFLMPVTVVIEGFFALFHPQRQRLGDRIANTVVIRKEEEVQAIA